MSCSEILSVEYIREEKKCNGIDKDKCILVITTSDEKQMGIHREATLGVALCKTTKNISCMFNGTVCMRMQWHKLAVEHVRLGALKSLGSTYGSVFLNVCKCSTACK